MNTWILVVFMLVQLFHLPSIVLHDWFLLHFMWRVNLGGTTLGKSPKSFIDAKLPLSRNIAVFILHNKLQYIRLVSIVVYP